VTRKSLLLDTNAIIHFVHGDDEYLVNIVYRLLSDNDCFIPTEVLAEVVYNLRDKYEYTRKEIADRLKDFINFKDSLVQKPNVIRFACNTFASTKLDFVDCLLDGYAKVNDSRIFTFDGDLKKRLEHLAYNG
jgi:predicted nucleic-acid-binding protein